MLAHWTEKHTEVMERLVRVPRLLIVSDFDGTLSKLVDRHDEAVLHPEARPLLARLRTLHPRVRLAFLSGRSLSDLANRLETDLDGIILGGNHGLELRGSGLDWTHSAGAAARADIEMLAGALQQEVVGIEGAEIEDKGVTLTLHYRRVSAADLPELQNLWATITLPDSIQRHLGNKVVEFRPRIEWNKGHALRRIMKRLGIPPPAVIYLGDDVTDEDAFQALNDTGTTVHIGASSDVSSARLWARDPADAIHFLREITVALINERGYKCSFSRITQGNRR